MSIIAPVAHHKVQASPGPSDLLRLADLHVTITTPRRTIKAVGGVDLNLQAGEILALVGESGSGKTMTAASIVGLLPRPAARITQGRILFRGRDLLAAGTRDRQRILRQDIAFIVQSSLTSLNPTSTIGRQLADMIAFRNGLGRSEARREAERWLGEVGIEAAERVMASYPHRLSGGMRQRVLIAMAINSRPKLIIADEPTTALDTATQKQILALLSRIRDSYGTAILLITHDFGVVSFLSDRIAVMQQGRIVETGQTERVLAAPQHPYTATLIDAVPRLDHPLPRPTPSVMSEQDRPAILARAAGR
ncbi:ABC transporter ATP-binding protein [Labrys neptuniae]